MQYLEASGVMRERDREREKECVGGCEKVRVCECVCERERVWGRVGLKVVGWGREIEWV